MLDSVVCLMKLRGSEKRFHVWELPTFSFFFFPFFFLNCIVSFYVYSLIAPAQLSRVFVWAVSFMFPFEPGAGNTQEIVFLSYERYTVELRGTCRRKAQMCEGLSAVWVRLSESARAEAEKCSDCLQGRTWWAVLTGPEKRRFNWQNLKHVLVKLIGLWCLVSLCLYSHQFVHGDHTWQALPFANPVLLSVRASSVGAAHSSSSALCADSHRLLLSYSVLK